MNKKTRVVFYSGGLTSFEAARRTIERHGQDRVHLLFTDTLIEDGDLYRFLVESSAYLFNIPLPKELIAKAGSVPNIPNVALDDRAKILAELREHVSSEIPQLHWIADGRNPWELFQQRGFLGNNRIASCSQVLKRETAKRYLKTRFEGEDLILYLGINWDEQHRIDPAKVFWYPRKVVFPLLRSPHLMSQDIKSTLDQIDIQTPALYSLGFPHNNCGGFCVRAGQKHFSLLLEVNPAYYEFAENQEEEMREKLQRNVSHLARKIQGKNYPLTLKQLRMEIETGTRLDLDDFGGCGCFSSD